ncbi:uncharacterized protein [Antedon mediterranea]|uniref:uncharacterized protein n=1 Tax=Antedon mediterranea TaxID=105859 RepID=UPI003AF9CEEF
MITASCPFCYWDQSIEVYFEVLRSLEFKMAKCFDGMSFVNSYYLKFENNRPDLREYFLDTSTLSFEGGSHSGKDDIMKTLMAIPGKVFEHEVVTLDTHDTVDNMVVIYVQGKVTVDGKTQKFSEVFLLKRNGDKVNILELILRL